MAIPPETQPALAPLCPVCAEPCQDQPLYTYTPAIAAAHFCPSSRDPERNHRILACIQRLWGGGDCIILRCGSCGFGFGHPFVGGDEEFYGILHEQQGYPSWRWDYDVAVTEAVNRHEGGRVLDIGAGVGMFLRRLGSSWKLFAVEGSESTRKKLEADGITVFRDLAEAARTEAGTFQVITLFQVLEHIAEFETLLQQCRQLLVPGGSLVVTVPDGDAMIRQERLTRCADMPPNHINKWTPDSLRCVLERLQFSVGPAIPQPATWGQFGGAVHMKLMADAARGEEPATTVYRIQNKPLRIFGLAAIAAPTVLRLLPYVKQLRLGGAFALIAEAPN